MAHHDQKIATMFNDTLRVLNGGSPSTTTDEGINLVQEWIGIARSNDAQVVVGPLDKLRTALDANDVREVENLLRDLSERTIDLANTIAPGSYQEDLQNLSTSLKDFAQALAK